MTSSNSWIKASASNDAGACVEMRQHADLVEVRDSKNAYGPVLGFPRADFCGWLTGAKAGEFDHLSAATVQP